MEYEIYIRDYIRNNLGYEAYLWKDTPELLLLKYKIIGTHEENRLRRKGGDTGVDIIQIDSNISFIQCKCGYKDGLRMKDLSGFMFWMAYFNKINGYVYYTDKLSCNVKLFSNNDRIKYIQHKIKQDLNIQSISYDYQKSIIDKVLEYFDSNNRGILPMPCGTGKTFISYHMTNKYDKIIFISPLKQFAKQTLQKYKEYGYNNSMLLVDSDGNRNISDIDNFIKKDKWFISTTYASVDLIYKILELDMFIIIDEFHNLSKNNIYNSEDNINKLLNSNNKIMFMSATPRVYEIEDDGLDITDHFGDIIYNMSFNHAILNKYITDYQIWLPVIHEDNTEIKQASNCFDSRIIYLFSCLVNHGSKKCIIYCLNCSEINDMMKTCELLNEFYHLDLHMNFITNTCSKKNREASLTEFSCSNKIELLFSVRILDECIDIPKCDSIYITYTSNSKIRTIQRLARAIRKDKTNPNKIGNIYIWCDEYQNILETLSGIKEYDIDFNEKIKLNVINQYGTCPKEIIEQDEEIKKKYIIGIKEYKLDIWFERLDLVDKYIEKNKKRPINELGNWTNYQFGNYKKKIGLMKIDKIYDAFTLFLDKHKDYFIVNQKDNWMKNLKLVMEYIDENEKIPSQTDPDENISKLGHWLSDTVISYKKGHNLRNNEKLTELFKSFMDIYGEYFIEYDEKWINTLNKLKAFIDKNKKRPNKKSLIDEEKYLGNWITDQLKYKKDRVNLLKYDHIYNIFIEFLESEYGEYFLTKEEKWHIMLDKLDKYLTENNEKIPPPGHQLRAWRERQMRNYRLELQIMKDINIRKKYEEFLNKHK